jgi:hypothetical protein
MSKKVHIGRHGTPKCCRGMSMHRAGVVRPSITVPLDAFSRLPREQQCQKCAKSIGTSAFAAELGRLILGPR